MPERYHRAARFGKNPDRNFEAVFSIIAEELQTAALVVGDLRFELRTFRV
jgi:hypothetical protein